MFEQSMRVHIGRRDHVKGKETPPQAWPLEDQRPDAASETAKQVQPAATQPVEGHTLTRTETYPPR